jgi:hypothetical protein
MRNREHSIVLFSSMDLDSPIDFEDDWGQLEDLLIDGVEDEMELAAFFLQLCRLIVLRRSIRSRFSFIGI